MSKLNLEKLHRERMSRVESETPVGVIARYCGYETPPAGDWEGRRKFLQRVFASVAGGLKAKLGEFGLDEDDMTLKITIPSVELGALRERLEEKDMMIIKQVGGHK